MTGQKANVCQDDGQQIEFQGECTDMRRFVLYLIFGCLFMSGFTSLHAATQYVLNYRDSGEGSFRQAVADAQAGDTIDASKMTKGLPENPLDTSFESIKLESEIVIDKDLSIQGGMRNGFPVLGLDGLWKIRALHIKAGHVILNNIVISKAHAKNGGGVYVNQGSDVIMSNLDFSFDEAESEGGDVYIENNAKVKIEEISAKWSNAKEGGSVMNYGDLTISKSIFFGCYALNGGAVSNSGTLLVISSMFTGNKANNEASSIYNRYDFDLQFTPEVNILNTTIEDDANRAIETTLSIIYNDSAHGGLLNIGNSIVVGNELICKGNIQSQGYNIFEDKSCSDGELNVNDKLSTGELIFVRLNDYNLKLKNLSPAIDAGDPTCCLNNDNELLLTDIYGNPRVIDGNNDRIARIDIGAMESQPITWTPVPGDFNGDDIVDAVDLNTILRLFVGVNAPSPSDLLIGDVRPKPGTNGRIYGDGMIGSDDLNWLLRRFLGLVSAP